MRSERLQYDLLFKWFLDLNVGDPSFNASTFSKNRERLLRHEVADAFFAEVVAEAQRRKRDTHVSRTDPEAQLYTNGSGQTAKLCYLGHVLTEHRNGLVVGLAVVPR